MATGSSGRPNSGSKGFDFTSDDILCSYEDSSNGSHSDPAITTSSTKDFHKSRLVRPPIYSSAAYSQPEDSFNQDVIASVEKVMKFHVDGLMRFLEGLSSRLSQLELYCYNLDKSIGEMRSELTRDHGDQDAKLKSLEKHVQEVHRSVQILRDKQELADAQKELAKLQLAQRESSSHSQSSEDRTSPPAADPKKIETSDASNQQLALVIPNQVPAQQQPVAAPTQNPPPNVSQPQAYYMPPAQMSTQPGPTQIPQSPYVASDPQCRTPQMQDISRVASQVTQPQVNQTLPVHSVTPYQQQWSQTVPQQVQPPHPTSLQPQMRPPTSAVYSPYHPGQPTNPPPPETLPNSMPMQVSYSGIPPPVPSRPESMPYGYGGPGRMVPQQPPPQSMKGGFGPQPNDGYMAAGPHAPVSQPGAYMVYDGEGVRAHAQYVSQQSHLPQSVYPPGNVLQTPQATPGNNVMVRNPSHPQFVRNHPYNELIEKLVSMGFRGDHVASVIQRMEESGQPVDFNAVLDRLNSAGSSQRGWSG